MKDEGTDENLSDSGCTVTSAIEALEESGTCLESLWPYKVKRANKCPSDEAFAAAGTNRINDALQIKIDLYEMKSCLAQGFLFVFGLELYQSKAFIVRNSWGSDWVRTTVSLVRISIFMDRAIVATVTFLTDT